MLKNRLLQFLKGNLLLILLIVAGTVSWSLTMVKSGLVYSFGMGFWGANGHDGVWHLALINSLSKGSFNMPTFAGESIKNYHLGYDLLLAFIHNITAIPSVNLYFQIIPPILAILAGVSVYLFVDKWSKSKSASLWATFFVYFGGDLAWLFGKGESTFWSQQSISTLINPPFAFSLVVMFLGLYFLMKEKSNISLVICMLLFGSLLEIKAYAGVMVLGSLFAVGIWQVWRERSYRYLKVFAGASLMTAVLFVVFNKGSENVFIFQPFWFLSTLFNLDRFSIPKLASAIANYNLGHNVPKLILAYIFGFVVFWVGNMGSRLIKEFEIFKWLKKPLSITPLELFCTSMIIGGALVPTLFVQKGTPWNTIQFLYYSLIFSSVLAGIALKNTRNKILIVFIILITIPTTIITLKDVYIPGRPPAKISNEELSALSFLLEQPDGVVLTYPFDSAKAKEAENNPPRPLYLYDSTAYVSAFSSKQTYLEDEVNLNITDFDWRGRRENVEKFLNTLNANEARSFLKGNNIKYVYWVKPQRAKLGESQLGLSKIFENSEVNVYEVK